MKTRVRDAHGVSAISPPSWVQPVLSSAVTACAAVVLIVGAVTGTGWLFDVEFLKQGMPGLTPMKMNASLAFAASGAALLFWRRRSLRMVLGGLVFLLGVAVFAQYGLDLDFGIDQLVVRDVQASASAAPGRLAPLAAGCFAMVGLALVLLDWKSSLSRGLVEVLSIATGASACIALLITVLVDEGFYPLPTFTAMALQSSVSFLVMSVGVLCAVPNGGLALLAASRAAGRALWLGYTAVAVLLLLVGVASGTWLSRVASYQRNQTGTAMPRVVAASELKNSVLTYVINLRSSLRGDEESRGLAVQDASVVMQRLTDYESFAFSPSQKALAQKFSKHWVNLYELGERLRAEDGAALAAGLTQLVELRRIIQRFIEQEMEADARKELESASSSALRDVRRIQGLALVLLIGSVLATLVIGNAVGRIVLSSHLALADSEQRYRLLVEQMTDGIFVVDEFGRCVDVSQAGCEMLAMTREEVLDRSLTDVAAPEEHPRIPEEIKRLATGDVVVSEWRLQRKDGTIFTGEVVGRRLANGQFQIVVRDVTERKQAEETLRLNEERLRIASAAAGFGTYDADLKAGTLYWSSELRAILGLTEETPTVSLSRVPDFVHSEDRSRIQQRIRASLSVAGSGSLEDELRILRPDGVQRWVLLKGCTLFDGEGNDRHAVRAMGVLLDVTARKQVERALLEQRELLEAAVNSMPVPVCVIGGGDLRVQLLNPAYQALAPNREIVGKTLDEVWTEAHQDLAAVCRRVLSTGESFHAVDEPYHVRLAPHARDRTVYFTWSLHRMRLPDGDGWGLLNTAWETTARVRAEQGLRQSEERHRELARQASAANAAKDKFLAMLSHELRTPLSPVLMLASERANAPEVPQDLREDFAMIRRNVQLEARLIDDLLDVTRIAQGKMHFEQAECDMHAVIRKAFDVVRAEIGAKQVRARLELEALFAITSGDRTRLQQVIWNLLRNAAKFTPAGGCIVVNTANEPGWIHITVADTGIGIAKEDLDRVFGSFEQVDATRAQHQAGLGLGLAISASIVGVHGGRIWAESEGLGLGATFHIKLPVVLASSIDRDETHPSRRIRIATKSHRILVVEDHEPTRATLTRLLQQYGHVVMAADCISRAREFAAGETFDVAICDLGLPDGSGHDLMRELRGQYRLRGISLSGFGMEHDFRQSREAGFTTHIVKPISIEVLVNALEEAVG